MIRLQQVDKKSFSTIHTIRGVVRPAFQLAVDDDLLRKNPFEFQMVSVVLMVFRTKLDQEWAEALDYFRIHWIYLPKNLKDNNGTPYCPEFYTPEQGVFLHVMSEDPLMDYWNIQHYHINSEQMCVFCGDNGRFHALNESNENTFICRCIRCGKYFFSKGVPGKCPLCEYKREPIIDFILSENGAN